MYKHNIEQVRCHCMWIDNYVLSIYPYV